MSIHISKAELVCGSMYHQSTFHINELKFKVPLDYSHPNRETIVVTARMVLAHNKHRVDGRVALSGSGLRLPKGMPVAVYLVGGPGSDNPPTALPAINDFYMDKEYAMLYMDYRGTGKSTPLTAESTMLKDHSAYHQADTLALFRQDNIVRDLEAIRKKMIGNHRWMLVGQSFGGWIAFSYLSFYPEGLKQVLLTGGVAPVGHSADTVYSKTYRTTIAACDQFYATYPEDVENVRNIVRYIVHRGNAIPMVAGHGAVLTAERFLCLGRSLGVTNGLQTVHEQIAMCIRDLDRHHCFTDETLHRIDGWLRFEERPLYHVLHEAIYADGTATDWSAWNVGRWLPEYWWLPDSNVALAETPLAIACRQDEACFMDAPIYLSAEHVYPFHLQQFASLKHLRAAAELLAVKTDWAPLYDTERLRHNKVPIGALAYVHDLFVNIDVSRAVAEATGSMTLAESNDHMHTAIKDFPSEILPWTWSLRGRN